MRIKNRVLTATLYTYVQPVNAKRAKAKGKDWGSFSNYVNYLIAKDHGDTASVKASQDMREVFLTPSPARTSTRTAAKTTAKRKVTKGKKSKRVSKPRTKRVAPVVSKKSSTLTKQVTSSKKTRTKSSKKPGIIGNLIKIASKKTTGARTTNGVHAA